MARDHADQLMTDAELNDVSKAIREQRDDICEYLASEGVDVSEWGDDADTTLRAADRDTADSWPNHIWKVLHQSERVVGTRLSATL